MTQSENFHHSTSLKTVTQKQTESFPDRLRALFFLFCPASRSRFIAALRPSFRSDVPHFNLADNGEDNRLHCCTPDTSWRQIVPRVCVVPIAQNSYIGTWRMRRVPMTCFVPLSEMPSRWNGKMFSKGAYEVLRISITFLSAATIRNGWLIADRRKFFEIYTLRSKQQHFDETVVLRDANIVSFCCSNKRCKQLQCICL